MIFNDANYLDYEALQFSSGTRKLVSAVQDAHVTFVCRKIRCHTSISSSKSSDRPMEILTSAERRRCGLLVPMMTSLRASSVSVTTNVH